MGLFRMNFPKAAVTPEEPQLEILIPNPLAKATDLALTPALLPKGEESRIKVPLLWELPCTHKSSQTSFDFFSPPFLVCPKGFKPPSLGDFKRFDSPKLGG
ncbi:hypothetical protein C7B82_01730 [Stenomitos frigidus ULC18]|uniref:Uncharacterized protein n=1 Tax=Stenomitos frigidus ULC18 TaxID=2107698 RepID=A0A2T1EQC1_9CYAN|nr:hypothetical protein C7B82_01730 [Stenomitos frigidus ULC18]